MNILFRTPLLLNLSLCGVVGGGKGWVFSGRAGGGGRACACGKVVVGQGSVGNGVGVGCGCGVGAGKCVVQVCVWGCGVLKVSQARP